MGSKNSFMKVAGMAEALQQIEKMVEGKDEDRFRKEGMKIAFEKAAGRLNAYQGSELEKMMENDSEKWGDYVNHGPVVKAHLTRAIHIVEFMGKQIAEELTKCEGEVRGMARIFDVVNKMAEKEKGKAESLLAREQKLAEMGEEAFLNEETGRKQRYPTVDKTKGRRVEDEKPAAEEPKEEPKPKRTRKKKAD